jgi:hypothetical protein
MMTLRRLNLFLGRGIAASTLAGAFLLVNACEPNNSTIGSFVEEPVAGGECERAGETRGQKDGCNDCTCGADLRWACTTLACDGGSSGTSGAGGTSGASGSGSGGAGASGGTAGSAGSGASGGSAGSSGSGGSAGTGGCSQQCSASEVSWHTDGGFVASDDASTLAACTAYRHIRTPRDVLLPQRECSVALECAEQAVDQALSRADVQAAFDYGMLFGWDARPIDGQLLVVTYQGKELTVGYQCTSTSPPTCIPIPTGVVELVAALRDLDQRMLMRPECANVVGR